MLLQGLQMENLFEGNHRFVNPGIAVLRQEEGRHFTLPLLVDRTAAHLRPGAVKIGSFQIAYQESIGP